MKKFIMMFAQWLIPCLLVAQSGDFCNFYIRSGFDSECIITNYKPDDAPQAFYDEHQCLVACRGSQVIYSIVGLPSGATYDWAVSGADSYTTNTGDNTITVNWSESAGIGTLILSVYGQDDEFCEKQLCVDLVERPVAGILSNPVEAGYTPSGVKYIDVCDDQEIQFYDRSTSPSDSPIVGYYWRVGNETSSTQNFTFVADCNTYGPSATIVHYVVNECGCEDSVMYIVNISKYPRLNVDCFGTACENTSATYHATSSCTDYIWYVDGGHIQDGQGTSSLTVMWDDIDNGYGYIALDGTACGQEVCPYLTYLPIPVISDNAEIQGPDVVCIGDMVYYELPLWASTAYTWNISPPGYTTYSSGHRHKLLVKFNYPGTYTINCNYNCSFLDCGGTAQSKTVIVTKSFEILADNEACVGESVNFSTGYPAPDVFDWTIYQNGTAIYTQTANNINYTFNTAGGYTVEAYNPNFCNTAYFSININALPPAPQPDVTDWTNRVCLNNGYEYSATPSSPEYYLHWSATCVDPSQFDGNDYNVSIQSLPCTINLQQVNRSTGCVSSAYQYQLTQFVPQTINWPTYAVCANDQFTMSVTPESGVLLEWSIPSASSYMASIVSDRYSNSITVQTNGQPGIFNMLLKRIFCDTFTYDTIPVTIKPYIIPAITLPKNVCQYSTVAISASNTEQIQGVWTLVIEGNTYTYTGLPSGATWNYTFNNSGTIPISLSFSPLDCPQTYVTVERLDVTAAPQFSLSYHEITPDALYELNATLLEPNAVGYSYSWSDGHTTQQFLYAGAYFSYSCTVTDNTTGCTNAKAVSRPQPTDCAYREDTIYISGSCSSRTFVRPNAIGNITWMFEQNASTPQFTTSGTNNNTCNATFTDAGYYRVYAVRTVGDCEYYNDREFYIPLIARMNIQYICGSTSGTDIALVLQNTSDFMSGTTINSVTWYVDGILVSTPYGHPVTSGTHTITLTVNYTYNGVTESCSATKTVTYNRGTTAFTVSPGPYCSETGIQFTDNSTNAVSWNWQFSNSISYAENHTQSPEQSFVNNIGSPLFTQVVLTTYDHIGCHSIAANSFYINQNTLVGNIGTQQSSVCYGNPWPISFNHIGMPSTSPVYHWHETNQTTYVATNNFYETGSYYVRVTDNNGCATQSKWENICFKSLPVADIFGDSDFCPDGTITLIGESGDNTYQWTGLGASPISTANLNYDITANNLLPGNYTLTLTVTKDGCSSTDTKAITVHSAPAAPNIGFGTNSCLHIPPVNLISTASLNLNWSTGDYGTSTETYNSGYHTAYYTDPTTGCHSANAVIDVPKPPDFNELMSGCFWFCKEDMPREVLGPLGEFNPWKWYRNNTAIQYGYGWINNPLNVPTFGTYFLDVVYGGSCSASSDNLVVKQKKICDSCNIEISLNAGPWCVVKDCNLRLQFYLNIYNPGLNSATLQSVTSPSLGTLYTPYLPTVIPAGTTSSILFEMDITEFEPEDMYMELMFYDGTGRLCISHFSLNLSSVLQSCLVTGCSVSVDDFSYLSGLSSSGMSYYQYLLYTLTGMSNVRLYSDDVTIIDVNYNSSTGAISGLISITPLELQQLIDSSRNICFRMYACRNGDICRTEFCIPASMLSVIGNKSVATNDDEVEIGGSLHDVINSYATDFCLYPNPATSSVSISGDNFSRATVIDMGGRVVMEVYDTTFNIGTLRNGEYIVKVISLDGAIQYLKLIKR